MSSEAGKACGYSDHEAIAAIEDFVSANADLELRLKNQEEWVFRGSIHYTAYLASIINSSDPLETDAPDVIPLDFSSSPHC
jgi:hypothetical protein